MTTPFSSLRIGSRYYGGEVIALHESADGFLRLVVLSYIDGHRIWSQLNNCSWVSQPFPKHWYTREEVLDLFAQAAAQFPAAA